MHIGADEHHGAVAGEVGQGLLAAGEPSGLRLRADERAPVVQKDHQRACFQ
jgi:hypothetical protein